MKFKAGDIVRAIESIDLKFSDTIVKGDIYMIEHTTSSFVYLKGHHSGWFPIRFELVEENNMKFKVGDKVRCINSDGINKPQYNCIYTISKIIINSIEFLYLEEFPGEYNWRADRFKRVESLLSMEEQIERATDLLNKNCIYTPSSSKFKPTEVLVRLKGSRSSGLVNDYLKDHDYCVCLTDNACNYPACYVEEMEDIEVEVKLNGNYTAVVTKDKIVVGCQTFSPSILKELQEAYDKACE